MPLLREGRLRKRWRWVGAFGDRWMVFAADVEVGPVPVRFWGLLDRSSGRLLERSRRGLPLRRPEVTFSGDDLVLDSSLASIRLGFGESEPVECVCPTADGNYTWTRKRCGMGVAGEIALDGETHPFEGRGVIDESAGYHPRHTAWSWSAGVGRSRDGRDVAWNLVSGINDPASASERAIWVDGSPSEPGPVSFDGLEAIGFADGSTLRFAVEAERSHSERLPPLVSSAYRAPLGSFTGALADGIELEYGLGVMERHEATW